MTAYTCMGADILYILNADYYICPVGVRGVQYFGFVIAITTATAYT
jgi:hypothetical protein